MAPTITTQTHTLIENAEVSFGTVANASGFDFIDAFVDGSGNPGAVAEWRLYEVVGALTTLVATAPGGGETPCVLNWQVGGAFPPGGGQEPYAPAEGAGFTFELRAFFSDPTFARTLPSFTASLVGYDEFDVAANADSGAVTVQVPTNFQEVTIATLPGYAQSCDVNVSQSFDVPIRFTLYAKAGVGGVQAEVAAITLSQKDSIARIFSPVRLPGAASYILTARFDSNLLQTAPTGPVFVSAGMATHSQNITMGGVVTLTGNVNGPSNANRWTSLPIPANDADVVIPAVGAVPGDGWWQVEVVALSATRRVLLPAAPTVGEVVVVTDLDGSFAGQTFNVDGNGFNVEGVAVFAMDNAYPGPNGSTCFVFVQNPATGGTEWAIFADYDFNAASPIAPGPQITTLRSVVPTVPTQVVWASTGYIDFVADCGADPTGVADAAPAMTRAWNFMLALAADPTLAETTLQLFIPPGKYSFLTSPIEPDFNFKTTTIEIYGCGDASIIQVGVGAGNFTIAAQNMFRAYIHDLAFVGLISPLGVSVDCSTALVIAPRDWLIVERVRFIAVVADAAVVLCASGPSHFEQVEFGGCGCTSATGAVLWANFGLCDLVQVNFSDIPILNGYNFSGGLNSQTNLNWFLANGPSAGTTGGTVTMRDCLFDESAQTAILIDGGAGRIPYVRLENILVLASAIAGSTGCVRVLNVDNFEIDGYIASGQANPAIDAPILNLHSVTNYKLRALSLAIPTALSRAVVTDAASKGIIEASPGIVVSQVLNAEFPQQARGTAAAGGGTLVLDVPVPLDTVLRIRAVVLLTAPSADGTQSIGSAGLIAMAGVNNKNGITSFGTNIAGSKNPQNSADLVVSEAEWADAAFLSGIGAPPTAVWTVTGGVARLTVTNPSAAGVNADVSVTLEVEQAASPVTVITSPLVIGGLLVYQRADLGVTLIAGKVSQWTDQSGSGDPNRTLTQAVAGQRPVYVVNDPAFNNRPTLQFVSANSDSMTSLPWAGGPFVEPYTVMVIGTDDGTAASQVFVDNEHGAAGENLVWNQAGFYFIAGVNTTIPANSNPKIIIAEHSGAASPVNINTNTGMNLGALGENVTGMTVGATITPGVFLNGKIAEVAIWNRVLTGTEKAQLNAYAAARYGIPISP